MADGIESSNELLDGLVGGDRRALIRVTRLVTARLRRLGAYDLRGEWDDICQEVVWALVRAVRAGRAPACEKVVAYINRVTWNQFVNWLRKQASNSPRSLIRDPDEHCNTDGSPATACADVTTRDTRLDVRRALAGLRDEWQVLLVAHYIEGESIERLVETTAKSRATVNRELRRAREAFRELLSEPREGARNSSTIKPDLVVGGPEKGQNGR